MPKIYPSKYAIKNASHKTLAEWKVRLPYPSTRKEENLMSRIDSRLEEFVG
jgi:hypothetical protein